MLFVNIPFEEKDTGKQLGARWNPSIKKWYIPSRRDYNKFGYWLANRTADDVIVIFDYFYLIRSYRECYKCGKLTPVIGFAFDNYALLYNEKYEDDWDAYENGDDPDLPEPTLSAVPYAFYMGKPQRDLCIISDIPPITAFLKDSLKNDFNYYQSYSQTIQRRYNANHCVHCKALQGNNFLYEDIFESPFDISNPEMVKNIEFTKIKLPCDLAIKTEWCAHFTTAIDYFLLRGDIGETETCLPDLTNLPIMAPPCTYEDIIK